MLETTKIIATALGSDSRGRRQKRKRVARSVADESSMAMVQSCIGGVTVGAVVEGTMRVCTRTTWVELVDPSDVRTVRTPLQRLMLPHS